MKEEREKQIETEEMEEKHDEDHRVADFSTLYHCFCTVGYLFTIPI